jgi:predicted dehydrogenase
MSRRLRTAVIGVGHLGKFHARIHKANPRAELVGLIDSQAGPAGEIARELGVPLAARLEDLPGPIEAVSIAVPTVLHAAVAVPLLERGIHCLVEKPIAASGEAAREILAAARRGRALLSVGHVERFQPGLVRVREMNLAPRFIECHRLAPFSFRSMDVGVVHDLMIHDLDLVLNLVDSEVVSFDASGGAILTDHEDVASVRLVFANGARANLTASRASLQPMRRFRMFSREAYVSLDMTKNYGLVIRKGPEWESGREALRTQEVAALAARKDWLQERVMNISELDLSGMERPLQAEIDDFLACAEEGRAPLVSGEDGLRALELADRISAAIRSEVW